MSRKTTELKTFLLGIDVGTGSVRAGVFFRTGEVIGTDHCPITLHRSDALSVEQSSDEIWNAVVQAVHGAVANSGIKPDAIAGIGFDATCSLVVLGANGTPLPVGDLAHPERNIMVWMDHDPYTRAVIAGLTMERDLDSLISLYIAGLCGIGYGLRQIINAQENAGAFIKRIVISGGAGRHDLIRQLLADATGIELAAPNTEEPVLLGSAILGSVASGIHPDIPAAMERMSSFAALYTPRTGATQERHAERFRIFEQFQSIARQASSATKSRQ